MRRLPGLTTVLIEQGDDRTTYMSANNTLNQLYSYTDHPHLGDKRSPKSVLSARFPSFRFEVPFSEHVRFLAHSIVWYQLNDLFYSCHRTNSGHLLSKNPLPSKRSEPNKF